MCTTLNKEVWSTLHFVASRPNSSNCEITNPEPTRQRQRQWTDRPPDAPQMTEEETTVTAETVNVSSPPEMATNTSEREKPDERVTVYGPIENECFGKRIRKSFGSRAFWGTVVTSYVVSNGLFYKVSFDDGDVDILSSAEVQHDLAAAKRHADEDTLMNETDSERTPSRDSTTSMTVSAYVNALRTKKLTLKRRRDSIDTENQEETTETNTWQVKLWSVRLFATIMEEDGFIRLQNFVSMPNGEPGEMESTGAVRPGDALLAVGGRVVHGIMDHVQACDLIRTMPRPLTLTFIRPPARTGGSADSISSAIVDVAIKRFRAASAVEAAMKSFYPSSKKVPIVLSTGPTRDSAVKKTRVDGEDTRLAQAGSPLTAPTAAEKPPRRTPKPLLPAPTSEDSSTSSTRLLQAYPEGRLDTVQHLDSTSVAPDTRTTNPARIHRPQVATRTRSPPVEVTTGAITEVGGAVTLPVPECIASYRQPPTREPNAFRGEPEHRNVEGPYSRQLSSVRPLEPPSQETTETPDPGQLRTELISGGLANQASVSSFASSRPVPAHLSGPLLVSRHGQPTQRPARAPAYETGNVVGRSAFNGVGTHPSPNLVVMNSRGFHHMRSPLEASSAYHSSQAMNQRDSINPATHGMGVSMSAFNGAPRSHGQGTRFPYSHQTFEAVPPPAPLFPSPRDHSHFSTSTFQRIPPQLGDRNTPNDERPRNMTLGDYMVNTAQQERLALRAATARSINGMNIPTPISRTAPSRTVREEPRAVVAPIAGVAHHREASPRGPSEGTSFEDFDSVFTEDAGRETGSSFLSLNQSSFLDEIPVNTKQKVSRIKSGRGPLSMSIRKSYEASLRPPYLSKYDADGVVEVGITQSRLYLTLAPMGQYVSVSSFVRGDAGEMGEIEASGKVLIGDALVGVGSVEIPAFTAPSQVARIVSSQPLPYTAYFIRATWEMLE